MRFPFHVKSGFFFMFFLCRFLHRFLNGFWRSTGIQNASKMVLKCKKTHKTSVRNACVFFKVFGHDFYGFGDPQTLDFDQPSYGFEVFPGCRRLPLEVDSASQKSSTIGLKSRKSCKRTFRGRLDKYMIFRSFV